MEKELRERIINLICSKDQREYFLKIQEELPDEELLRVIGCAPIHLGKKKRLFKRCMEDTETEESVRGKAREAHDLLRDAFITLYHPRENIVFRIEMHEFGGNKAASADVIDTRFGRQARTYRAMKDYMETTRFYDWADTMDLFDLGFMDDKMKEHPEIDWDARKKEMLEPKWYWKLYADDLSDPDQTGKPLYEYICSPAGEPQYLHAGYASHDLLDGGLCAYKPPTSFRPGDILRISCGTYAPKDRYCLVMSRAGNELFCVYPTVSGKIELGMVSECYYYENYNYFRSYLPPMFCAERYEGELPESCSFMKELSGRITQNPDIGEKLCKEINEDHVLLKLSFSEESPSEARARHKTDKWQIEESALSAKAMELEKQEPEKQECPCAAAN